MYSIQSWLCMTLGMFCPSTELTHAQTIEFEHDVTTIELLSREVGKVLLNTPEDETVKTLGPIFRKYFKTPNMSAESIRENIEAIEMRLESHIERLGMDPRFKFAFANFDAQLQLDTLVKKCKVLEKILLGGYSSPANFGEKQDFIAALRMPLRPY